MPRPTTETAPPIDIVIQVGFAAKSISGANKKPIGTRIRCMMRGNLFLRRAVRSMKVDTITKCVLEGPIVTPRAFCAPLIVRPSFQYRDSSSASSSGDGIRPGTRDRGQSRHHDDQTAHCEPER